MCSIHKHEVMKTLSVQTEVSLLPNSGEPQWMTVASPGDLIDFTGNLKFILLKSFYFVVEGFTSLFYLSIINQNVQIKEKYL